MTVQPGLCQTWSETTLLVFPRGGSNCNYPGFATTVPSYNFEFVDLWCNSSQLCQNADYIYRRVDKRSSQMHYHMSRPMGKPTFCIGEHKGADQLRGNREAAMINAFVFVTRIVQSLLYLTTKFQASSLLLCLYMPVCVGPVRKPHCWFFYEAAQLSVKLYQNVQ